jgi:hypothetical protein
MCIACEQEAMWFAYLQRRGLITPDGRLVEQPPSLFVAEPVDQKSSQEDAKEAGAAMPAGNSKPARDDPTAG